MKNVRKPSACLLLIAALLAPAVAGSDGPIWSKGGYELSIVSFRWEDGETTIEIRGDGSGERGETSFRVDREELLELIRVCYKIRFFELPASFGGQGAYIDDEGRIQRTVVATSHPSYSTISVRIGEYVKAITFDRGSTPQAVWPLVGSVVNLTDRAIRARQAADAQ